MTLRTNDIIFRNRIFLWIALAVGLVLLIPLIAMQFTSEVNWDASDFVVMGILLLGTCILFVFVSRKITRRRRVFTGFIFAAAFLYIWAELAVGIFTNFGS